MLEMLVSLQGEDGLHWAPGGPKKPWFDVQEPFAMVHGQGRYLRAMIAWHQYTGEAIWKERIDRLVRGLDKMVVHKDDYAYFPVYGWHEGEYTRSCYTKKGWKDTVEPTNEKFGEEGSLFNHQGHVAGCLATWYVLTGNEAALRLSGELVKFLMKPKFWADFYSDQKQRTLYAQHAHWEGHLHGHVNALRAILEYALAANDVRLQQFVRDGYEWTRQRGLGCRLGPPDDWQGCGVGRLIGLAVKLSEAGVGDYWEDVDWYVRNHGSEMQILPEDKAHLQTLLDPSQPVPNEPQYRPCDVEKMIGGFCAVRDGAKRFVWLCCSPHGNMGLFYAWDATIRHSDGTARVNLLLNRASPWMDVDSYIPYEGKVVLKNKTAKEAFVRVPLYVNLRTVRCTVGTKSLQPRWFGRYLRIADLRSGDEATITFPLEERSESWYYLPEYGERFAEKTGVYACKFKGNTLLEITPPLQPDLYRGRLKYRSSEAPKVKVSRFVTPLQLRW